MPASVRVSGPAEPGAEAAGGRAGHQPGQVGGGQQTAAAGAGRDRGQQGHQEPLVILAVAHQPSISYFYTTNIHFILHLY